MQNSAQIEAVAASWLAKRDSGDWSEADEEELSTWLRSSTAHRVAFLRLEIAWSEANRLQAFGAGAPPRHTAPRVRLPVRRMWQGLAASLIVGVAAGLAWLAWTPDSLPYSTAVGGMEAVPLADGSTMSLDTDTEVRVSFSDRQRSVEIVRGEALFEVARDPVRPFVVLAGEQRVVALGTRFSVRRDALNLRVVVTEGVVRMETTTATAADAPATELPAGSLAKSDGTAVSVRELPAAEIEDLLSWRNGFLTFRDTPLEKAVEEFNRYNRRKIVLQDAAVGDILIGGRFRSTNVDAFVRLLGEGFDLQVERRDDRLVVLHAADSNPQ